MYNNFALKSVGSVSVNLKETCIRKKSMTVWRARLTLPSQNRSSVRIDFLISIVCYPWRFDGDPAPLACDNSDTFQWKTHLLDIVQCALLLYYPVVQSDGQKPVALAEVCTTVNFQNIKAKIGTLSDKACNL